jgi:predicted secreted protein
MATKIINGTDLALSVGGVLVGCATSSSLSVSTEMIDAACKESGSFYDALPGMHTATLSTDGLVKIDVPADATKYRAFDFGQAQLNKTLIAWKFGTAASGEKYYSGNAYITSFELSGEDKQNATYSVSLQVVGTFSIGTNA